MKMMPFIVDKYLHTSGKIKIPDTYEIKQYKKDTHLIAIAQRKIEQCIKYVQFTKKVYMFKKQC